MSSRCTIIFPEYGPNHLEVWLGSGIELESMLHASDEMVEHFRAMYASKFGIVHSLNRLFIVSKKDVQEGVEREFIVYARYLLFFNTREEMKSYESRIG